MIQEYTVDNPIRLGKTPILLEFYATWCGPCKMQKKYLEEFSRKHPDIPIYTVNVEECPDDVDVWKVQNLPTLIYESLDDDLVEGKWRHTGLMTVQMLEEKIKNYENN